MKTLLCLLILSAASAAAEPFTSGQPLPPAAGKGTRVPTPGKTVTVATTSTKTASASKAAAKDAIRKHAETYFLKTYVAGSAGTMVMTARAIVNDPQEVPGWPNKLSATGTVELVVTYKGREQNQTRSFDAVIDGGKVVDFNTR